MTINNRNNKTRLPPVGDGAADVANNTTPMTPPSNPFCIRLEEKRSLYRRNNDDGLDWLRQPSNDLPAGAISKSSEISMLTPDGSMRVVDTYSADQWHSKNQMDRRYDGRYEGQVNGDPLDRSIHSSSGLRIGKPRSDDNNNNSSSGLNV